VAAIVRLVSLCVLATVLYVRWRGIVLLPAHPAVTISLVLTDTSYRIQAYDAEKDLARVEIYKNGKPFYRAFAAASVQPASALDRGVVSFVFDDGWLDVYRRGYPILKSYGIPATVGIIQSYVDEPGALSSRQLHKLIGEGWDIAAHSLADQALTCEPQDELVRQLIETKAYLWDSLWAAESFMYPHGKFDDCIERYTKNFYMAARTYATGVNVPPIDPFDIKVVSLQRETGIDALKAYVDTAERDKVWLVFVGHHVLPGDGGSYSVEPRDLDELVRYARQRDVRIATFGQALQELVPGASPVRDGELVWQFDKDLLEPGDLIHVAIDGKRSRQIRIPRL
jgi:peptidoglycan/xylan/chitin deacetylase (PgdA/CDA1 family)